jgi:hypothetical protein
MVKQKIDDEELGIESYHVKRQQAVERAMEKARRAIPDMWKQLSQNDLEVLNWILGEVWAFSGRTQWDEIAFSGMTLPALVKMIQIGDQVMHGEKEGRLGFEEVTVILAGLK